jgi:hypothetical protein
VTEIVTLPGGNRWQVAGTEFVFSFQAQSSPEKLVVDDLAQQRAVSQITIDKKWIAVRRGPAELDPSTFRLADHHDEGAWEWTSG